MVALPRLSGRMPRLFVTCCTLACAALFYPSALARALDVPPLRGRVNDLAGLLDATQAQALEQKLAAYERGSGHQFALLTLPSLEGDSLEDFSIRVVEAWKLGKKGRDDGILVLVAQQDRKMRIEVGYGLEGDVPDAIASRVIHEVMQPAFRSGDFYGGLNQAFDYLMRAAGGESVTIPEHRTQRQGAPLSLFMLLVIGLVLFRFFGPLGLLMMGSSLGGGHRYSGGGFGGGFSGGGGGFGGGGASGGW